MSSTTGQRGSRRWLTEAVARAAAGPGRTPTEAAAELPDAPEPPPRNCSVDEQDLEPPTKRGIKPMAAPVEDERAANPEPVKLAAAVNLRAMNPGPMTPPVEKKPTPVGNSCWQCTNSAAKYTILFRQKLRVKRFSSSSWSRNFLLVLSVAVGYFRLTSTLKMSCRSIVRDFRESFGNLSSWNFEVKISDIPGLSGHHRGKSPISSSELHDSLVVIQQSRWG